MPQKEMLEELTRLRKAAKPGFGVPSCVDQNKNTLDIVGQCVFTEASGVRPDIGFSVSWTAADVKYMTFLLAHAEELIDAAENTCDQVESAVVCALDTSAAAGKEAEELRSGIEEILKDGPGGTRKRLVDLLDEVDARDSLNYLQEKKKLTKERDDALLIVANTTPRLYSFYKKIDAARKETDRAKPVIDAARAIVMRDWPEGGFSVDDFERAQEAIRAFDAMKTSPPEKESRAAAVAQVLKLFPAALQYIETAAETIESYEKDIDGECAEARRFVAKCQAAIVLLEAWPEPSVMSCDDCGQPATGYWYMKNEPERAGTFVCEACDDDSQDELEEYVPAAVLRPFVRERNATMDHALTAQQDLTRLQDYVMATWRKPGSGEPFPGSPPTGNRLVPPVAPEAQTTKEGG